MDSLKPSGTALKELFIALSCLKLSQSNDKTDVDIANKKIKVNKLNSIFFNLEGKKFSDVIIPSDLTYIRY
jgi:hypothetical protein